MKAATYAFFAYRPFLRAGAIGATLTFGMSGPVHAEGAQNSCYTDAQVRPGIGDTVPGNTPGLVFRPPMASSLRDASAFRFQLRDSADQVVPLTVVQIEEPNLAGPGFRYLLKPNRILSDGGATLLYANLCNPLNPTSYASHHVAIRSPTPLPTRIGQLKRVDVAAKGMDKNCNPTGPITLRAHIEPPVELALHRATTKWTVHYKDQVKHIDYGGAALQAPGWFHFDLDDQCRAGQTRTTGKLTLQAQVAGAVPLPPLIVDVEAPCGAPGPVFAGCSLGKDAGIDAWRAEGQAGGNTDLRMASDDSRLPSAHASAEADAVDAIASTSPPPVSMGQAGMAPNEAPLAGARGCAVGGTGSVGLEGLG